MYLCKKYVSGIMGAESLQRQGVKGQRTIPM